MNEFFYDELNFATLEWWEAIIRLCMALMFGFIIGWDRDHKNKPVDFRAFMIVCAVTCMVAIMGQEIYAEYTEAENVVSLDMGKIISGVLTGIGFLGAGAIIKLDNDRVIGTATGASIWAAGGMGLALGFGHYLLATMGFLAVALTLVVLGCYRKQVTGHTDTENID